jgi:hypothetical protein
LDIETDKQGKIFILEKQKESNFEEIKGNWEYPKAINIKATQTQMKYTQFMKRVAKKKRLKIEEHLPVL